MFSLREISQKSGLIAIYLIYILSDRKVREAAKKVSELPPNKSIHIFKNQKQNLFGS